MDLFHFREESPGAVFVSKGWLLFQRLVEAEGEQNRDLLVRRN